VLHSSGESANPDASIAAANNAAVVGSGPNGLAAAITLAQAGMPVVVYEAEPIPGGGARTLELTVPGFLHDFGSAVHPMAVGSPFFRKLPLAAHGLHWIHSPAAIVAACPITVTRSRCPRAFARKTQNPFSALWKVTRSTRPAKTSVGCPSWVAAPSP